jgi:hypothetical protein
MECGEFLDDIPGAAIFHPEGTCTRDREYFTTINIPERRGMTILNIARNVLLPIQLWRGEGEKGFLECSHK